MSDILSRIDALRSADVLSYPDYVWLHDQVAELAAENERRKSLLTELYQATSAVHQEYDAFRDGPAVRTECDRHWDRLYEVRKRVAEMLAKEEP